MTETTTCGAEFVPSHTDYMERHSCALPKGHDGAHASVPIAANDRNAFADLVKRGPEAASTLADKQDEQMAAGARGEPSFAAPKIRDGLVRDPTTAAIAEANEVHERLQAENIRLHHALTAALLERNGALDSLADLERVFDIIKDSDKRAIAMFKEAHPDTRVTFPDRANMLAWILEQLDTVTREADAMRSQIEHRDMTATPRESDRETIARLERQLASYKSANDELGAALDVSNRKIRIVEDRREADAKGIEQLSAECDQLHHTNNALRRQRDEAEQRFAEANHHHGETSAALSAMTIKWLNQGNEIRAAILRTSDLVARVSVLEALKPPPGYHAPEVAELRIKLKRANETIAAITAEIPERNREMFGEAMPLAVRAMAEQIDYLEREIREWERRGAEGREQVRRLIAQAEEYGREIGANRAALAAGAYNIGNVTRERDSLAEQLRVADADRVPLAQDLQIEREKNKRNVVMVATMGGVTDKARKVAGVFDGTVIAGMHSPLVAALCELSDSVKAFNAAAKASADPAADDMPF